jgi:hypothetical protein
MATKKTNPHGKMTKRDFEAMFKRDVIPQIIEAYEQRGVPDRPARREAWNNTVDAYIRAGLLTESAGDWSHPSWLETYRPRSPAQNPRHEGGASISSVEVVDTQKDVRKGGVVIIHRRADGKGQALFDKLLKQYGDREQYVIQALNANGDVVIDNQGSGRTVRHLKARNPTGRTRTKNAHEGDPDYHRRNVILPYGERADQSLALRVLDWHGGQNSMLYSLGSTGMSDYVSPSMIDAGVDELESIAHKQKTTKKGHRLSKNDMRELKDLIGELDAVARFSSEFTTEEAGLGDVDSGYATWLMEDVEENPRHRQTNAYTAKDVNKLVDLAIRQSRASADEMAEAEDDIYDMARSLGWDMDKDEEFTDWALKATKEEILEESRRQMLLRVQNKPRQANAYKGDAIADAKRRKYGYPEPPKKDKRRKNASAIKARVLK